MGWGDFIFADPWWLLLLLLIPIVIWWRKRQRESKGIVAMTMPEVSTAMPVSWRVRLYQMLTPLFWVAIALMIISMARPQELYTEQSVKGEGIDIFLVMDLSSSMLATDFEPDRLSVSKEMAVEFVSKRPYDRIGLAVFAAESFTQCPLTYDHDVLSDYLRQLECGALDDGTAIGMGLAAAVNRLKESESTSKIVVLLTDGVNNEGYISPQTATELAKTFGIKVYAIGVGSLGVAYTPTGRLPNGNYIFEPRRVEIDENLLRQIASETGGKYYRATTAETLQQVYAEIDQLEKTEMEVTVYTRQTDFYYIPLFMALGLLTLIMLLRSTILRSLPE